MALALNNGMTAGSGFAKKILPQGRIIILM